MISFELLVGLTEIRNISYMNDICDKMKIADRSDNVVTWRLLRAFMTPLTS